MGFLYSQLFITPPYPVRMYSGQTIIVTGSNTGLGLEAARHFTRLGAAHVILAVRNLAAGERAKASIVASTHCDARTVSVWPLDLSSNASVVAFTRRANTELARIDVLLENAGVAGSGPGAPPDAETGLDRIIAVNVVRTFLLALLVLPRMRETSVRFGVVPRLTIVSSEVHSWTGFEQRGAESVFEALRSPTDKQRGEFYPLSKLLEVLVVRELAPKMNVEGAGEGKGEVVLNMLNPGLCHSELSRDGPFVLEVMKFFLARSTEVGSRTLVAAAAAGSESHGRYMSDGRVSEGDLSAFVRSEEGKRAGKKVWRELKEMLEGIEPGVTEGF